MKSPTEELLFFEIIANALKQENESLQMLFAKNFSFYKNQHHGICNLYETTMVYLGMKALLFHNFPYEVLWEFPYPNQPQLKTDLALRDAKQNIDSFIEFKIWLTDNGNEIRSDIKKYNDSNFNNDMYLFIIEYGGDIKNNEQYLIENIGQNKLKIIQSSSFQTLVYDSFYKQREIPVNLYFVKLIS